MLVLGLEDPVHLGDEILQMERLRQHFRFRSSPATLQRDGGKTGDEHHPDFGVDRRGLLGQLDPIHLRHDDVGQQQIVAAGLEQRLQAAYRPYHSAIEEQLRLLSDRFGCAILLDCHSMPATKSAPAVVFGDRFGRSAAPWVMAEAMAVAAGHGFDASANDPFAGGHILDRHGSPQSGIHALQVEIDRRAYLDSDSQPGAGFGRVAALFEALAERLGAALLDRRLAPAAE